MFVPSIQNAGHVPAPHGELQARLEAAVLPLGFPLRRDSGGCVVCFPLAFTVSLAPLFVSGVRLVLAARLDTSTPSVCRIFSVRAFV